MNQTQKQVFLVPHTHWDREWYKTFQQFRYRLVKLIDRLVELQAEDPRWRNFMLDGQVVALEDYLEVRPSKRGKLSELIKRDQLQIGPWYTLPDTYLVNGESLVRNLLMGHVEGDKFGGVMKEGWVPDPFGLIAQLPQIFQGFGINSAFMMRGVGKKVNSYHFNWRAPNGSQVTAHYLRGGYGGISRLRKTLEETGVEEWAQKYLEHMSNSSPSNLLQLIDFLDKAHVDNSVPILIPVGGDHLQAQRDLTEKLSTLNNNSPYEIVYSTLSDYAERFDNSIKAVLEEVDGELRNNQHFPLLPGTLSSRIHLKQANRKTESLLQNYAEPLASFSWLLGGDYEKGILREAWKKLLKNHAHDSICGCSIDQVHTENEIRFDESKQIAEEITEDKLDYAFHEIANSRKSKEGREVLKDFVVFNPQSWRRNCEVSVRVNDDIDLSNCHLEGPDGEPRRFCIGRTEKRTEGVLDGVDTNQYETIHFHAKDVPKVGLKKYSLVSGKSEMSPNSIQVKEKKIANQSVSVKAELDGSLTVEDKETGEEYTGFNYFEDVGDGGDTYNFSPPKKQKKVTTKEEKSVVSTEERGYKATMVIEHNLALPVALTKDHSKRSDENIECAIKSFVTLYENTRRVEIKTEFYNSVKDHRLRVVFPTGLNAKKSFADSHFYVVERQTEPQYESFIETPPKTHPQGRFVAVKEGRKGVAVLNKGLPEYEVSPQGTIYLTLLRAVGALSRNGLETREGHAGPALETPGAQCQRGYKFEYSIILFNGKLKDSSVFKKSREFNSPVFGLGVDMGSDTVGSISLLEVEPEDVFVSAIKQSETGESLVLRLFNSVNACKRGLVKFNKVFGEICKAFETNLNEKPKRELELKNDLALEFSIKGYEIKTLKFKFKNV